MRTTFAAWKSRCHSASTYSLSKLRVLFVGGYWMGVNDVVNVEMARAMKAIGQVNEAKGKRGYTTIAKDEVKAAADLDPELAPPGVLEPFRGAALERR